MKNKYYTPDITDIRIGLIYEEQNDEDTWIEKVLDFENNWLEFSKDFNQRIRVKYLTKEQIENEKWTFIEINTKINSFEKFDLLIFKKNSPKLENVLDGFNYSWVLSVRNLNSFGEKKFGEIIIEQIKSGGFLGISTKTTLYIGECYSINEFRYICKLLKIS